MSKKMRNYYLIRIIYTILFLFFSTTYWYFNIKDINAKTINELNNFKVISFTDLKKVMDYEINNIETFKINIKNLDKEKQLKIFIVPTNNSISNNYIKYQINNTNINSLNMDGLIYLDNLIPNEEKNLELKLWISSSYEGNLKYQGNIIIL